MSLLTLVLSDDRVDLARTMNTTDPVTTTIAAHKQRPMWLTSLPEIVCVWELHEVFEHDIESEEKIRAVLTAEKAQAYFAADAAATAAGEAEDQAWTRMASIVPITPAAVWLWLDDVSAHAAVQDEVVTLRRALEDVGGLLAERLASAEARPPRSVDPWLEPPR